MPKLLYKRSPNFRPGRQGYVTWFLIHYTSSRSEPGDLATLTGADEPGRPSAHFLIRRDGTVVQLVSLNDVAFHAGIRVNDAYTEERARRLHPNERSVGVEICNAGPPEAFTEPQYGALAFLAPLVMARFNIPSKLLPFPKRGLDPRVTDAYATDDLATFAGILGHGNVHRSKSDPGILFDWQRPLAAAWGPLEPVGPLSFAADVIRRGEPTALPPEGVEYA